MNIEKSFYHLPKVHKFFYLTMMIEVPILMTVLFLTLLWVVEVEGFTFLVMPLVFGVVSPGVVLKDLLNSETIRIDDENIVSEKRFGKATAIAVSDLKVVVGLTTNNRLVILLLSRDPSKIISVSDWYPMNKKTELVSYIKRLEERSRFSYREFSDKQAAMMYIKSLYK